ncbi:hypothetical protein HU200_037198 [Digitaria exilis]|uniref:Uncharacterized protein n=1 Tax=Digitaria exilis TaxID=1010633 RepID=A0A835EKK2_9POAL|nr:hypothetical protein HU200_037198 [Digitaria exilis]CAB3478179.1 unnamed protein product [Digitaria exilis]
MSSQGASRCAAAERRPFTEPIEIPGVVVSGARAYERAEEEDQNGEVVPPHVLLARRRAAAAAASSSVCSGQGRTLKGRDLRRVRESVLRMTGFIES